jgi:voltage-gated potassium channel Kch
MMLSLFGSPLRNLATIVVFLAAVIAAATLAYMAAGWSLLDAFYMVMDTIYTLGTEVHPVSSVYLRIVTIALMIVGCTGMILMTSILVQLFMSLEIRNLMGMNRVKNDIDRLTGHVVICGFGRIGAMLAVELTDGGVPFVILERDDKRAEEARKFGYLCLVEDATDEASLIDVGIARAKTLATVLPDDSANVFITLSARSLNKDLQIIARGEAPSTERKLMHAGADKVVLPTHIGAERIAEMILYPATANLLSGSKHMRDLERNLRELGLEVEVVAAGEHSAVPGMTVEELERRAAGAFMVAQVSRASGEIVTRPSRDLKIEQGDGLVIVGRSPGAFVSAMAAAE